MSNNKAIISIIIPTYNCAEFIDEGINSILEQLPNNCELIIVDDGSTDNTREVLSQYSDSNIYANHNIRIILNEHLGASGARNTGIDVAKGRYITFMDCDDMLQKDFLDKALRLLNEDADLYIFGIEWFPINGENELWSVEDRIYESNTDFADEYINTRKLLIYSNCNKFYKKDIIDKLNLRFHEGMGFGEDRLFNYNYIKTCGKIITSSLIQLKYLQREETSMSNKYMSNYFETALKLHQAKIDCFVNLSKNTTDEEKQDFIRYDLNKEINIALDRCNSNDKEKEENLELIKKAAAESGITI